MIQKTLVLLKPDTVKRAVCGEILQRFERAGLKIIGMKMLWIDEEFSKKHYCEHIKKDFYKCLEQFITSGPVIAICLQGIRAIEIVRKMVGTTEPGKALPGTIRGDFAHLNTEWANKKGKSVPNLIHASGNKEDAEREVKLWFTEKEIHSYKTSHEDLVF